MRPSRLERRWLRYAIDRSIWPGVISVLGAAIGAAALLDYVIAYQSGPLTSTNIVFAAAGILSVSISLTLYWRENFLDLRQANAKLDSTLSTKISPKPLFDLPEGYKKSGYELVRGKHGFGFWSRYSTGQLFQKSCKGELTAGIRVRVGKFKGSDDLRRSIGAKNAVNAIRSQTLFRNDRKIRLCSDLLSSTWSNGQIEIQETDYLATRITNDISFQIISLRSAGLDNHHEARTRVLYDGLSFFLNSQPRSYEFRGYRDSECSNQIGVSTLAFTKDGYLLLVDQLSGGLESAELIAPSGSGSLDWDDLPSDANDTDFWSWITRAATRELREELGLCATSLSRAQRLSNGNSVRWMEALRIELALIGIGGLMHRGGKPDLFFIAKLDCTVDDIRTHSVYSSSERFLSQRCAVASNQRLADCTARSVAELVVRNTTDRDSFPLELCFLMLLELCKSCPKALQAFLEK